MLTDIKDYLRIYFDDDDKFLTELIELAKKRIKAITGVEFSDTDELYKQCVRFYVEFYYNNRTSIAEKNYVKIPYTLECLMSEIQMRGAENAD